MIRYYKHINLSLSEIKDQSVLLVHALSGCMFHCFECINYEELVLKKHCEYQTIDDVIHIANRQSELVDLIVFSGGEFLMAAIDDLINDLTKVKVSVRKPVVIYTTGYHFQKLETLIKKDLVDGVHMDLKLPYDLIDESDSDLMLHTLGKKLNFKERANLLNSIELVVKTDKGFSQIRSVKYPFLDESAFFECSRHIKGLNDKYKRSTPYEVHPFYSVKQE